MCKIIQKGGQGKIVFILSVVTTETGPECRVFINVLINTVQK